ncbi:MAG: ATP-binding protein [Betaproteobacteria bacterium]|nr:ATP-binding protein [Betaproteobacteria bacterium]
MDEGNTGMTDLERKSKSGRQPAARGRLRIGDDWNAITIIALSQSNPLKAIAELVENSIDANARNVTITRGREHGRHFLAIRDDGDGVPRGDDGRPDFRYVATHICDSVKRRLKAEGSTGLQGEFGIGLLSFWTVGDDLTMTSTGADQRAWQMVMRKGDPGYEVTPKRALFSDGGTEVRIAPLLEGIRALSGEKIQWYLAAELRDRIGQSGVRISVIDKLARKQYAVEPRHYEGRLLHRLPVVRTALGDVYAEIYLNEPSDSNRVALFRHGTRVIEDLASLEAFAHPPWAMRYLQGHIDAPFVNLTPATRTGLVQDAAYAALCEGLQPLEHKLIEVIEDQRRAEDEQASRELLRAIQRAFREALLALPAEEYDWFDIHARAMRPSAGGAADQGGGAPPVDGADAFEGVAEPEAGEDRQRQFFEFAGPLFSVTVTPASSIVRVGGRREFKALPRDRSRRRVEQDLELHWQIVEGAGALEGSTHQAVTFVAPDEPGLTRLKVSVNQRDVLCEAEALITVTHELLAQMVATAVPSQGLPGYTFERTPGESRRSRFDATRNVIVINNGHRDFVHASRSKSQKLRYLVRLYAKELVLRNFVGLPAEQLLERMVELSLRTEEHL